jgi:hypothetical protein
VEHKVFAETLATRVIPVERVKLVELVKLVKLVILETPAPLAKQAEPVQLEQ